MEPVGEAVRVQDPPSEKSAAKKVKFHFDRTFDA
jgi:hypothetical protein